MKGFKATNVVYTEEESRFKLMGKYLSFTGNISIVFSGWGVVVLNPKSEPFCPFVSSLSN